MKTFGLITGLIFGGIVFFLPIEGLNYQSQTVFAVFIVAASWWVWNVLPPWATGFVMMASWAVFAGVPVQEILLPFSSDILWFILATLFLSSAMTRTGLADRFGLILLKRLPGNIFWIVFSFFITAIVLSPAIPANSLQAVIMAPIALGILESSGLRPKSPEAAYVGLGFMISVSTLSGVLPTSGIHSLIVASLLPSWYYWNWSSWLIRSIPVAAFTIGVTILLLGPVLGARICDIPKNNIIVKELEKKGPLIASKKEVYLIVLFIGVLIFVFTAGFHKLPYTSLGLIMILFIFIFRILDEKEMFASVDWGLWLWIGSITSIGNVFSCGAYPYKSSEYLACLFCDPFGIVLLCWALFHNGMDGVRRCFLYGTFTCDDFFGH
jgi:DASS family divalent anion:Na+ symporter